MGSEAKEQVDGRGGAMILKMIDNTEFHLTESQGEQVKQRIAEGKEFIVLPGQQMIKTKMIMYVVPGAADQVIRDNQNLIEDKRKATDEGIRKARERLVEKLEEVRRRKEEEADADGRG